MGNKWLGMAAGVILLTILLTVPALAGNNSGAAFSTWPDTGQTKCYDADGAELNPCPVEGEAFYGQDSNYVGPARSYTDLGSGMIQDNVTGLVWEQKTNIDFTTNYGDPHDGDNTYTWCDTNPETNGGDQGTCGTNDTMDVIATLNSASFGGHNDWRLPTIKELATLFDLGKTPAIDPIFLLGSSYSYCSSTTLGYDTGYIAIGAFFNGCTSWGQKTGSFFVRAVRVGQ